MVKSAIVNLTGDERTMFYDALLWMTDKLKSEDGGRAISL